MRNSAACDRFDESAYQVGVFAELAPASEAVLLEKLDGGAEEKPAMRPTAGSDLRDRLDTAAAKLGDLRKRALKRGTGDALAAMARVDIEALNPPIREWLRFPFVGAAVLDTRKLVGVTVLAPPLGTTILIEDKGGVSATLIHTTTLVRTVDLRVSTREALRITTHAPTAAEHPVVALNKFGER